MQERQAMIWSMPDGAASVTVTAPSWRGLLEDAVTRMQAGHGFSIATLNLDHAVKLQRDPVFRQAYLRHSHVTADGNPVVWLSNLAGQRGIELIPGSELILPLAERAAQAGVSVALLGSTEAALQQAADGLQARVPGLEIATCLAPPMGFDPQSPAADALLQTIEASGAGLCFVALGAPKQEVLAARGQERLPKVGFVSIGAGLDFIAGKQVRAPRIVRRLAIEWLWRLMQNPRRLAGRYAACILLLPSLTVRALRIRMAGGRT